MRRASRIPILFSLAALLTLGCGEPAGGAPESDTPRPRTVELGVPAGPDGLDFAPLEDGTELPLHTFGQGGTHLVLGVRTSGFGRRAFIGFSLENELTGSIIVQPPPARPQLFYCDDEELVCSLVPIVLMMGGIAGVDEERDGLPVRVSVSALTSDGVEGTDEREITLSTALLGAGD